MRSDTLYGGSSSGVLLYEENAVDRRRLEEALTSAGIDDPLRIATDPQECLRLLGTAEAAPRLILLDLHVPDIDGFDLLREVRSTPGCEHVPVVVLSASVMQADVARAYELGASSYVVSPVDQAGLSDLLRDTCRYWLKVNAPPPGRQAGRAGVPADDAGADAVRVLMVEDNAADAMLVGELVGDIAPGLFAIDVVETLAAAVAALQSGRHGLVLLDLNLPDSEGIETFTRIRQYAGDRPVVILTGQRDENLSMRALRLGAEDFLCKAPLSGDELVRTLRFAVRRAESETSLRRVQQLETMAKLAGGVAHDFNNMLQVIRGNADALREPLATLADAEAEDNLSGIVHGCSRASELMRQVLSFGSAPVTYPRDVDLDAVVGGTKTMLRSLLGRDVTLHMELGCAGEVLRADPVQLEQSILNLGLNARDALVEGGSLVVRTRRARAEDLANGGLTFGHRHAVLEVVDDGPGMDEETRARALEPFYTTKGPGAGSGLGLSSVYGVVRQLGGRMDLESTPGRGCLVRMVLPLEVPLAPASPPAARTRGPESFRILVVDDEPLVLAVVQRILKRAGFSPTACSDPREAIDTALGDPDGFDLLITDVVMPGTSGVEVYKAVREKYPQQRTIFISGYSDGRLNELRALPEEFAFVEKPFDRARLVNVVRDTLGLETAEAAESA